MHDRTTFLISGRAIAQIRKPHGQPGFFHQLYVERAHRRRGYGLELMKFAISYAGEYLEMDILQRAKSCQRNASRLGYKRTGRPSARYLGCELWTKRSKSFQAPMSRLTLLHTVHYQRRDGRTDVVYLSHE